MIQYYSKQRALNHNLMNFSLSSYMERKCPIIKNQLLKKKKKKDSPFELDCELGQAQKKGCDHHMMAKTL